jgi:hypothetical protein
MGPSLSISKANKYSVIVLLCFFFFFTKPSIAQMNGNFTVGGTNPDFETISEAIDSLGSGVNGNVVFNIRPGNYPGFNINSFPISGATDTITFQSENLDSSSVVIIGSVYLSSTSNLTFRSLTIRPVNGQTTTCLTLNKPDKIWFSKCRIEKTDNINFNPNDALVSILFDWSGGTKTVKFSQSVISAEQYTIRISGKYGRIDFENDSIYGTIRDDYGYPVKNYLHNTMHLNEGYLYTQNQYFEGNEVYLNNQWSWLDLAGNFKKNVFHCPVHIEGNQVHSNVFEEDVNLSYSTLSMVDNIIEKNIHIIYCHNSAIYYNNFEGDCIFTSDNQKVISNFFYGNVKFTQGPNQQIYNNNFGIDSKLEVYWCSAIIKNNILISDTIAQPAATEMKNNNFIPCPSCQVSMRGADASSYEALYVSDTDLHATNPVLIRKSSPLPAYFPNYDIDSVSRNTIPSMGANEICLHFPIGPIEQRCNDFICLEMCLDDFTGYYWAPSYLFPDSASSAPVIHPETSGYVYLCHADSGVVGSLYINVTPSLPLANQSYSTNGFEVQYENLSWCSTSVYWEFGDNTTSTEWSPDHTFSHSGIFHSKLTAYNLLGFNTLLFDTQILIVSNNTLDESGIKIYPNPATSHVIIEMEQISENKLLTVYDQRGKIVLESEFTDKMHKVDLSGFVPGLYLFKLISGKQTTIRKIVLQ